MAPSQVNSKITQFAEGIQITAIGLQTGEVFSRTRLEQQ
jgi:hypothetical protein